MKNLIVNPDNLKTIEQYAAGLMTGLISLETIDKLQVTAYREGLLTEDEAELGKTICWEIRRLVGLHNQQLENILEHTPLTKEAVLDAIKELNTGGNT